MIAERQAHCASRAFRKSLLNLFSQQCGQVLIDARYAEHLETNPAVERCVPRNVAESRQRQSHEIVVCCPFDCCFEQGATNAVSLECLTHRHLVDVKLALHYFLRAQKSNGFVVLIDCHPARSGTNAVEMYGFAKHAAFSDPLKTGHHLETPSSRPLNRRQKSGVVFSGKTDVGNHDNKPAMARREPKPKGHVRSIGPEAGLHSQCRHRPKSRALRSSRSALAIHREAE